jgi:zinc transporter ZupT
VAAKSAVLQYINISLMSSSPHFSKGLNYLVTSLLGGHHHHDHDFPKKKDNQQITSPLTRVDSNAENEEPIHFQRSSSLTGVGSNAEAKHEETPINAACPCCSEDPAGDLQNLQNMAQMITEYETRHAEGWEGTEVAEQTPQPQEEENERQETTSDEDAKEGDAENDATDVCDAESADTTEQIADERLMRMSINTALAIALHNFPEGLATFVAAVADPSVGVVLAIAIAIHNIPEGLCVAMPIYYATGNKWKAFSWACLSGVSDPFAALLGWAVLANSFTPTAYAILFGLVAGMMIIISVKELLPTAHRYDPEDTVVTYSFIVGMFIMALSLALFALA